MQFEQYKYERCNINETKKECAKLCAIIQEASDYVVFKNAVDAYDKLFAHMETMSSLCYARYTINTEDEYYSLENDYWDENTPLFEEVFTAVKKCILASPFLKQLQNDVPETFVLNLESELRVFDEKIVADLQEENRLCSEYQKLIAKANIPFEGEVYTLSSLTAKTEDPREQIRKDAFKAYWNWFEENEVKIDTIFDQLVKLRDSMAKKLGFKDFVEMGYVRMKRFDYNRDDVANYRKQVLKDVVPIANSLYNRQKKRLNLDTLQAYNENFEFSDSNPKPKFSTVEMIEITRKMYHELSSETGEFIDFMIDRNLLDLDAKKGKASGGYCVSFVEYNSPFIFSNFNGTQADVETLTHEAGHAFQVYNSMNIRPVNCIWPTYESSEIHSMSMEFLTWPWMKNFFEEDIEKFYYLHLGGSIKFIPYGILVDHFQHVVYENPQMTIAQRKQIWRDLEKQYLPHKDYSECPFLDKGTWWYRQSHIILNPFYYIDYTLAQVCALQFWKRSLHNDKEVFQDYLRICKIGGSQTFTKIVKAANLKVPFVDNCLKDVMTCVDEYLNGIDDRKL